MRIPEKIKKAILDFIVGNVPENSGNIVTLTMNEFQLSRPTVNKYMNELIEMQYLKKEGTIKRPKYKIETKDILWKKYTNIKNLKEDIIYQQDVYPLIKNRLDNVRNIIQYGITEMINNVHDHSDSEHMSLILQERYNDIMIGIIDDGIGIFNKIQKVLNLSTPAQSILELSKGKFTSDPTKHSGEGIFFTSRMFDSFVIISQGLVFSSQSEADKIFDGEDWRFKNEKGTLVSMIISKDSGTKIMDVFNEYSNPDKDPSFNKTVISVKLMQFEGEALLSRSQAKRLMTRVDKFSTADLNFDGVKIIGQAFADEIFRVFTKEHPHVSLKYINANKDVESMIKHVNTK